MVTEKTLSERQEIAWDAEWLAWLEDDLRWSLQPWPHPWRNLPDADDLIEQIEALEGRLNIRAVRVIS